MDDGLSALIALGGSLLLGGLMVLAIRASLNGARAPQRAEYAALRDRLGLTGPLSWDWASLVVDWRGTIDGVPVRVLFIDGGESSDAWALSAELPGPHARVRVVTARGEPSLWQDAEPFADARLAPFRLIRERAHHPERIAFHTGRIEALARLASLPDLQVIDFCAGRVEARFSTQTLPPAAVEVTVRALAVLAR